jgi:hypothetical protein
LRIGGCRTTTPGERYICKIRVGAFLFWAQFGVLFINDTWRALCCLLRQEKMQQLFRDFSGGYLLCACTVPKTWSTDCLYSLVSHYSYNRSEPGSAKLRMGRPPIQDERQNQRVDLVNRIIQCNAEVSMCHGSARYVFSMVCIHRTI